MAEDADREAWAGQGRKGRGHKKCGRDAGTDMGFLRVLLNGLKLVSNFLY